MMKQVVSLALAMAIMCQGIARADEPARTGEVIAVPNRAALLAHLDGMAPGDHVAIATADGVIAGELVDKDADDVVIDQPLIEGGAERIAIPLNEIQGVRHQATGVSPRTEKIEKAIIVAGLIGAGIWLLRALMLPRP
jgi:hypothetical protein